MSRSAVCRIIPLSYIFHKVAARNFSCIKITEFTSRDPVYPIYNHTNLQLQRFSQQPNDALIVDYDYVKKATNSNKAYIIDVREPDEIREHGKIPNSINIPLGNVTSCLSTMSEKDFQNAFNRPKPAEETEIIFYCMIGKRSGMAQQNALHLGYKNAKNYVGSWNDWASKV